MWREREGGEIERGGALQINFHADRDKVARARADMDTDTRGRTADMDTFAGEILT